MANAGASRSKSAAWRWATAVAFSLFANSLVAGLFWELRATPEYELTSATVVQIVPSLILPRRSAPMPKRPPLHSARIGARPASVTAASPGVVAPFVPSAPTAAPPGAAEAANLSRTLRGAFGCNLDHLTEAERVACAERLAANRPATPPPLNLDPHLHYASDPEPYLTRMPKNACKVRAAGDAGPMGQQGVAAGVSCAWSF